MDQKLKRLTKGLTVQFNKDELHDLESEYGKKYKPLRLYKRLINHTQISHDQAIKKHIGIFQNFCVQNRETITTKDDSKLINTKLEYSERVFFDLKYVFHLADNDTKPIIWQHILTISAIIDPTGKAKEILKKSAEDGKTGKDEADFLTNIISKVEKNVKPDANPMEAISSIMSSGVLNDMMSDLGSKKLDLGKLIGAVQNMVSTLNTQTGDNPDAKNAMGMLSNLTSMVGNNGDSSGGGGMPDMSGMFQMMTSMMSGMNMGGTPKVEELDK